MMAKLASGRYHSEAYTGVAEVQGDEPTGSRHRRIHGLAAFENTSAPSCWLCVRAPGGGTWVTWGRVLMKRRPAAAANAGSLCMGTVRHGNSSQRRNQVFFVSGQLSIAVWTGDARDTGTGSDIRPSGVGVCMG
jgi:hypothetical protein